MGFRSQRMWCDFLGIPENTWNHFERGRRPITVEVAAKLVGKTGVSLDWIFLGNESTLPMHVIKKLKRVPPEPFTPERLAANG
jgi:plasmid maintenance system antidote protein VapI